MMPESPPSSAVPPAAVADERHVFVYGTLRRGGRNDINRLTPAPRFVGMGAVPGRLYRIDWYPGLRLGGAESPPVVGEVYAIAPGLEAVLDDIEQIEPHDDSEYFKREVQVDVDGRRLACLVYEIHPRRIHGRTRIEHGDWIRFHTS